MSGRAVSHWLIVPITLEKIARVIHWRKDLISLL